MIEFLRRELKNAGPELVVKIKFAGEDESRLVVMVDVDQTGIVLVGPQDLWTCFPWAIVDYVATSEKP
jgi:hypothetical protein